MKGSRHRGKRKIYTRVEPASRGCSFNPTAPPHGWLPLTGQQQRLILTQDDASRRVMGAQLVERDTAWDHLQAATGEIPQQRWEAALHHGKRDLRPLAP